MLGKRDNKMNGLGDRMKQYYEHTKSTVVESLPPENVEETLRRLDEVEAGTAKTVGLSEALEKAPPRLEELDPEAWRHVMPITAVDVTEQSGDVAFIQDEVPLFGYFRQVNDWFERDFEMADKAAGQFGAEYFVNHTTVHISEYRDSTAAYYGYDSWNVMPNDLRIRADKHFRAGMELEKRMRKVR